MTKKGLEKEAQSLYSKRELSSLQTVGYREWFDHFEGKLSRNKVISEIQKNSRRYAKRQMTWFKKIESTEIKVGEFEETFKQILKNIK